MLRVPPPPDGRPPRPAKPPGIAFDDDPYLGLLGVAAMRDTAEVLEEHHVDRAVGCANPIGVQANHLAIAKTWFARPVCALNDARESPR
jgi:hypothetical protein